MSISMVGDIFCDIVASNLAEIPSWGEDALCKDISIVAGGSLLNSAVHGANFSAYRQVDIQINAFGVVGLDTQGDICMKAMRQHPLIVDKVIEKSEYTTGTCIVLSGEQDRLFVTSRGCIEATTLDWFKNDLFLNDASHVHAAGFYNFTQAVRHEWRELFEEAKHRGLTTSLNPQYDASGLWVDIKELCIHLDFLITNELELRSITKQTTNRAGAEVVCAWGCKCVVVTNSEGATAYIDVQYISPENEDMIYGLNTNNVILVEPVPDRHIATIVEYNQGACIATVHDTCGAGDAFAGAFLVELLRTGGNLSLSLLAGCTAGSAAVQLVGGSTVPSFEMLASTAAAISAGLGGGSASSSKAS